MDDHDVYLVHASEDTEAATALASSLRERGLNVWFNSFQPGLHLKAQMEEGLMNATCGVLFVTSSFSNKPWVKEEVEALYGLDAAHGGDRIVPVWSGVTAAEVRAFSPMLAMRSAIIDDGDRESLVARIVDAVLIRFKSRAQWLRLHVNSGFAWLKGPKFLPESFEVVDSSDRYEATSLEHCSSIYAAATPERQGRLTTLLDVVRAPEAYRGRELSCIGSQGIGTGQVLELHHAPAGDEPGVASYVFQLRSIDFTDNMTAYVHCVGPWQPGAGPWVDTDLLVMVSGVVLAYGAMPSASGSIMQAVYLTAFEIVTFPRAGFTRLAGVLDKLRLRSFAEALIRLDERRRRAKAAVTG